MIAIDVGNTHIKAALFEGDLIRDILIVPTLQCINDKKYLEKLHFPAINEKKDVALSSVNTKAAEIIIKDFALTGAKVLPVTVNTEMGIKNLYRSKETLGIDRLVNASAVYHFYPRNMAYVIIDMGTATTIDFMTSKGEFLGGAIAPGLLSSLSGLNANAPALPVIKPLPANKAIGATTAECMASGSVVGHAAMIREISRIMSDEHGEKAGIILTGGLSALVENWFSDSTIDRNLTLKGIRAIYELNRY